MSLSSASFQSVNAQASAKYIRQHPTYYLTGGDLFFLVGGQILFRVHRYFFIRDSLPFRYALEKPSPAGQLPLGANHTTAICLDDVTPDDFSLFLWVFYNPKYSLYEAGVADWVAILALAQKWEFTGIKELALSQLQLKHLPVVDRVIIYQDYDAGEALLLPLYAEIAMADEPPTREQFARLGIETTTSIFFARERIRSPLYSANPLRSGSGSGGFRSPLPSAVDKSDVEDIVKDIISPSKSTHRRDSGFNSPTSAQSPPEGLGSMAKGVNGHANGRKSAGPNSAHP